MKLQQFVALGIVVVLVVWMLLPHERNDPAQKYESEVSAATVRAVPADSDANAAGETFTVRVSTLEEQDFVQRIRVRGMTQARRLVTVRAETSGRVVATPVERGGRVAEGDLLCELAQDTREADLQEARSRREQAQIEYDGALDLQSRGLTSRAAIAQLKATLDSAIAAAERAELALQRTRVTAPFAGVVESRGVEVGDLMDMGGTCATLLDDEPMLLTGVLTEDTVGKVSLGADVTASLASGKTVHAELTYVARASDASSRGYPVEAQIHPTGFPIRHGITAEIYISASNIKAHLIQPSALTLDDEGATGVKLVDDEGVVQFARVQIVGEDTGMNPGFWVTGLPPRASVIILGQEIVFPGQQVNTVN